MPEWLFQELKDNDAVKKLNENHGTLPLTSFIEEALVIATSFIEDPRSILVIKQNLYHAQRLYERITSFLSNDECAFFGADESLRVESIATSPEMTAMKVETMASLSDQKPRVIVTCPSALLRHLPSKEVFHASCITIKTGDSIDINTLKEKLIAGGYQQAAHIDQPLSFASRGGIIDVWSINCEQPVRIEFFDTEIESIRFFDVSTQKTVRKIDHVNIVPASDVLFTMEEVKEIKEKALKMTNGILPGEIEADLNAMEAGVFERRMYPYMALLDKTSSILDYMNQPLIIFSDEKAIQESVRRLIEDTTAYIQEMVQEKKLLPKYAMWHDLSRITDGLRQVKEDPFEDNISKIEEMHLPNETLELKLKLINEPGRIVIALAEKEYERVRDACDDHKIAYALLEDDGTIQDGLNLTKAEFTQGFFIQKQNLKVYTAAELFEIHYHKGRYENKFRNAEALHSYDELEPGDYIVHSQYGVGQYLGIETRTINNAKKDFLKIVYRGNAELLVPLEQFHLVRKFVSREGVVPRLNQLGSGEWEKTKEKLQKNVENIAGRLLKLYTTRETHIGYAFSKDTELTEKFENAFPYELTRDQEKAVEDIKKDMESDQPMDRLVCGDVGFGKTEVAIRASFKAVQDHKQVAVLCPTTILAEQHFRTFIARYEGFPVTIKVMDRFVPVSEQKKTLQGLQDGTVDIVIGTHRILSKDIVFKDLGLLVIDEEQRFGVEHKERIKEMKNNIDVLALSATPIPRTLQMSLIGVRQLSQLDTPPLNRYSVQTYVVEKNQGLIVDAIEKELARDGQVFYLYNNIDQIYNTTRTLQHLLPHARIGIVHGQMDRETIEDVMLRFTNHEIDVLVCTTIVENGIDIPNVNTIIIENAQDFGLSQIYQIKGRVGRSNRIAYAYLMIPSGSQLSDVAKKRLQAVKEFATLGSGYKIAMRDLTIRGAGDLLGSNQSGFINTVGIDMYIEMLNEAIEEKKSGKKPEKKKNIHANVSQSSYIPESFTSDDFDRLGIYQKIETIRTSDELKTYEADMTDQYGKLPKEVEALFEKKYLDILMNEKNMESYREMKNQCEVTFSRKFSSHVNGAMLFELFSKISKDISLRYTNGRIVASIPKSKKSLSTIITMIERSDEALKNEN